MEKELPYVPGQMMALMTAKELKDGEIVFVGIGLTLMAGIVAQMLHAPNLTIVYESGCIGPRKWRVDFNVGDSSAADGATALTSEWRVFGDLQAAFYDVGVLGAAQVDKYGNINSTAIFGEGDYYHPQVRLPGSGGGNDIGSSVGRTVIMMKMQKKRFLPRVDYITTPGYLDGTPQARQKAGLVGGGPVAVVTDKAVFRFDPQTHEMYLDTLYPGITVDEIKSYVNWDLKTAPQIKTAPLPTKEELAALKRADPGNLVLGREEARRQIRDIHQYVAMTLAGRYHGL
ncbi:MAG: glutaconate CoA-transferase [Clostridia bacterium]|nr:glutaconate CoA-transferase [Clostridia bacterium]